MGWLRFPIFARPEQVTAWVRAAARLWRKAWIAWRTQTCWRHSGGFILSACNYKTTNKPVSIDTLLKVRSEFNDELNNHSDDEGEPEDEDDEEEDDDDTDNNSDGDEEEDDTREECNKDNEDADVKKENGIIGPTDSPEKAQSPVRRRSRDLRPPTVYHCSLSQVPMCPPL